MEQNTQILRKKINNLLTVDHILINVVGDSSVEQHQNKIRCYCPIHGEKLFRTLTIDIEDRTFRCSYTMCAGFRGGDLLTLYSLVTHTTVSEAIKYWSGQLGLEEHIAAPSGEIEKKKTSFSQKSARTAMIPHSASEKLSKESIQDSIFDFVQREIDRTIRYKRALSLVLLEIEQSVYEQKTINPEFQERFFKAISEVIVNTIRVADAWACFDTDHYVVLLPETDQKNAETVTKKLKASILKFCKSNSAAFPFPVEELQARLHLGIAGISDSKQNSNLTAEVLFHRAEQFLKKKDFKRSVSA